MQINESIFAHAAKLYLPIVAKLPAAEAHRIMERIEGRLMGAPIILPELIFDELLNLLPNSMVEPLIYEAATLADDDPSLLHTIACDLDWPGDVYGGERIRTAEEEAHDRLRAAACRKLSEQLGPDES